MEGLGNGCSPRLQKKRVVEDCLDIDVRYLAREGLLPKSALKTFILTWSHNYLETDQVMASVSHGSISLYYQQYLQGENVPRQQRIIIDNTPCHYGRQRPWFRCPNCIRRCAIIYLGGQGFHCRKCYQLPYRSQQVCKLDRLIRKRVMLEERLYDTNKGLHYRTLERLRGQLNEIEDCIMTEMAQ